MQVPSARADIVLTLFDEYYERVYAFIRKSTNPEVAEDLAQEVFVRLLQHPELERLTISVSYLLKIAHNLLRRRFARATRLRELLEQRQLEGEPLQLERTPLALDSALLEAAMGLLTSDEHNAVRLIVCEGRSYQHAAESLGVTVTTINNWKHRGLSKLRRSLDEAQREAASRERTVETRAAHARRRRGDMSDSLSMPVAPPLRGGRRAGVGESAQLPWRRSSEWAAASDDVA